MADIKKSSLYDKSSETIQKLVDKLLEKNYRLSNVEHLKTFQIFYDFGTGYKFIGIINDENYRVPYVKSSSLGEGHIKKFMLDTLDVIIKIAYGIDDKDFEKFYRRLMSDINNIQENLFIAPYYEPLRERLVKHRLERNIEVPYG